MQLLKLSKDFTLHELTHTSTGLVNKPDSDEVFKLTELALHILQPIRDRWGALKITSGFRSYAVNSAAGGVPTSQHCFGEAADFVPLEPIPGFKMEHVIDAMIDEIFVWIVRESGLKFGQCINEHRGASHWIHVSLPRDGKENQEALDYDGKKYTKFV